VNNFNTASKIRSENEAKNPEFANFWKDCRAKNPTVNAMGQLQTYMITPVQRVCFTLE